jgi:hypothetical protein
MADIIYPTHPETLVRPPQHPPLVLDPLRPPRVADAVEVSITREYPLTLDPDYQQFIRLIADSLTAE